MFAVLGLGEALARAIAFGATVWIARRLGADAYGVIAVAAAIVAYCAHLADFSVEVLGARALAQEPGAVDRLAAPLVLARLAIAAACIAALAVIGAAFFPQPDGAVLAAYALSLVAIAGSTRFVFLGTEQPAAAALVRVGGEAVMLGLVVLLAKGAGDVGAVPVAKIAGEGAAVIALALLLRRRGYTLPVRRDPAVVRPMFVAAAPLVAHAILGLAIFNSDLIFLRALRDARTAGIYAAAYTLISFLINLGGTYGNSFLPVFTRLSAEPERQRALYAAAMTQVLTVALPLAVGGWLLAGGLIDLVFGATYAGAVPVLQILIWSVVVAYTRTVVTFALIGHGRQSFVLRTSAWSAAANLVLNATLIPPFGMVGAAVATLATEALRTAIGLAYGAGLGLGFGYVARLWRPALGAALMGGMLLLVPMPHVLVGVVAGAVVYGLVLLASGGIRLAGGRVELTV